MLAIKECLMREGVFNSHHHNINNNNINNNNNNNRNMIKQKYQLQSSDSNLDLLQYQKSVASQSVDFAINSTSSNNLSSTSATANTSCQQQQLQLLEQQQQQHLEQQESKHPSQSNNKKPITRYQGHHPHFRHHTTPAYYTDVHLRIHTPDAADVAALNENYRSVYSTPSKLLAGEHYFSKSATATVAPPPIGSNSSNNGVNSGGSFLLSSSPKNTLQQQRSAFFRGASVANLDGNQRKNIEPYKRSSTSSVNPTKGELCEFDQQQTHPDGNVLYGCMNLKPSVRASSLEQKTSAELGCAESVVAATPSPRSGRLSQRFSNRKRAVRVRSESRPISALYDIICKEKGLDNGTSTTTTETTTNDEDSSSASTAATPSHEDAAAHKDKHKDKNVRHKSKKHTKSKACNMSVQSLESPSLVGTNSTTSSNNLNISNNNHEHSKRSTHARLLSKHTKKRTRPDSTTATTPPLVINDLNLDDDDDDTPDEQQRAHAMSPRLTLKSSGGGGSIKSSQAKASSLPPYKVSTELLNQYQLHQQQQQQQQHQHHHHYLQQCARNDSSHDPSNSSSHSLKSVPSLNYPLNRSVLRSPSYSSPLDATYQALPRGNSVSQHNGQRDQSTQPSKLYIEPVKLLHSDNPAAVGRTERLLRSTGLQRRFIEEQRRKTDGAVSMIPTASSGSTTTTSGSAVAGNVGGYRSSDGEQQSGSLTGLNQSNSSARRFITRPNRTPSRGRSKLSAGISSPQRSDSSSPQRFSPNTNSSTAVLADPESLLRLHIANGNQQELIETPHRNSSDCSLLNGQKSIVLAKASSATVVMTNSAPSSSTAAPAVQTEQNCCLTATAAATTVLDDDDVESAAPNVVISADKKKDLEQQQQKQQQQQQRQQEQSPQRFSSPTSPRYSPRVLQSSRHIVNNKTYRRHSSSSDNPQKSPTEVSSESDQKNSSATSSPCRRLRSAGGFDSSIPTKKLVPTMVSLSMKQNLNELQFNGESPLPKKKQLLPPQSPKQQQQQRSETAECTIRIIGSTNKTSSPPAFTDETLDDDANALRPRTSTMFSEQNRNSSSKSSSAHSKENSLELSPIQKQSQTLEDGSPRHLEDRDKSSKRKSNLNRSLNEEATHDGDETAAARRRRRRELGMARQLIPNDDPVLREIISPQKSGSINTATFFVNSPKSPRRNNLAFHMENARRGLDLVSPPNAAAELRRRAQTASPRVIESPRATTAKSESKLPSCPTRINRRSDTLPLGGGVLRKMRSNDVNRKLNERTKSDLAEIIKIAEMANDDQQPLEQQPLEAPVAEVASKTYLETPQNDALVHLSQSMERIRASNERELASAESSTTEVNVEQNEPSLTTKHATFVKESHTHYYDHNEPVAPDNSALDDTPLPGSSSLHRKRMLKARSVERDDVSSKFSPILRRKSTADEPTQLTSNTSSTAVSSMASAHNHIVSILKKNPGESSSASSNASPVTFSASVMDTPTKHKRAGILKKRSSLDESRYYSRSHSPDERSILIKSARRNSLEETAAAAAASGQQHGILKQSSYDSCKSDGCPSATESYPHGILKKKDSSSTPSDGGTHVPKHVSISQAVILAAAELCKDSATERAQGEYDCEGSYTPGNEDYDLRPILKLESATSDDAMRQPKPILKKKSSSGESDELEIRPILKTSRKSSREEFDISSGGQSSDEARQLGSEYGMRPILKIESPCKRRSLGGAELEGMSTSQLSLLQRRTRSLERTGDLTSAASPPLPGMDLAAALNAIGPQSTTSPIDFVAKTSTTLSVADRIKNMEKFLVSANSGTPIVTSPPQFYSTPNDGLDEAQAATNTSWESPLQSGAVPKLYRPSAIKRDFYRCRYKTQPVTNDEKNMFFKTLDINSPDTATNTVAASTVTASAAAAAVAAPSAFKPTKSLDALNYVAFANLNSESPTSPPRATSSHSLARSATQPLQVVINSTTSAGIEILSRPLSSNTNNTPYRSRLYNNNNNNNNSTTSNNVSEQLTLSVASDSERIFDMSSLGDEDSSMQDTSQATVNCDTPTTPNQKIGDNENDKMKTPSSIARTNSVRARANMFAQLQEKTKLGLGSPTSAINREERTPPRIAPRRLSPAPQASPNDEPKTPNNPPPNPDDEIEPSSLPLSERLRFFSNLSNASRSSFMSYTRNSPTQLQHHSCNGVVERSASANGYTSFYSQTTPRSSLSNTSGSSTSVTPTPMECSLCTADVYEEEDDDNDNDDAISICTSVDMTSSDTHSTASIGCRGVESVSVTTSAFLKLTKSASHSHVPTQYAHTPMPTALTPTAKRIKLKTIGKLMLPKTFLSTNERNNNSSNSNNIHSNASDTSDNNSLDSIDKSILKKIGKIKSPFIENCQQLQQKQQQLHSKCMKYDLRSSPSYSHVHASDNDKDSNECVKQSGDDNVAELGKENIDLSSAYKTHKPQKQQTPPVVEMRNKFTRIMSGVHTTSTTATMPRLQQPAVTQRHTYNGSSPIINEKYAKYFGLSPPSAVAEVKQESNSEQTSVSVDVGKRNMQNISERCRTKTPLLTQRHLDLDELMPDASPAQQPIAAAVNRNVRLISNNAANNSLKRREVVKRSRAMTTIVNGTPPNTLSNAGFGNDYAGRMLRAGRSLTITHGVKIMPQVPKVHRFEDITVTKEEFQLASKEFERIFLGIA